jgi:hypothetical protein
MTKVVINTCYGGFNLSHKGLVEYYKLKGKTIYAYKYDVNSDYLFKATDLKEGLFISYFDKDYGEKVHSRVADCLSTHDIDRHDPDLIKVVETLGTEANGRCAELSIVEIPDDVEYVIEEYDGNEHIAEKHRTWR